MSPRSLAVVLVSVFTVLTLFVQPAIAATWDDSVVRVFVAKRETDQTSPWQHEEIRQQTFHGLVVEGGKILTTAFAVEHSVDFEMSRFGESHKFDVGVSFVDFEINLALLEPTDPAALKGLKPVRFVDEIALDTAVTVMRARDNNQLISVAATLQEVGIYSSVTSEYSFATYLLKTQQAALGWGEPLVRGESVVALGSGQDNQYLHAIPGSIVNQFLRDVASGSYRGFTSIGIELQRLDSPEMRSMLRADSVKHGIRIAKVQAGSAFSKLLMKDDVLLSIDGTQINGNGFYQHSLWGRVHLKYLLNRKSAGDFIKLEILRQGERMTIVERLTRFDSNQARVVAYRTSMGEPHVIFGGVVLRELSIPYLKQWGKEWRSIAPSPLLFEFHFSNDFVEDPDQNRIVIVSRVLADEFNRGFSSIKNVIVREVNGKQVRSLADVRAALRQPLTRGGREFARIVLNDDEGEVVLSYDGLTEAHRRMALTYNIADNESFFSVQNIRQ